jgi:hypothetical protein
VEEHETQRHGRERERGGRDPCERFESPRRRGWHSRGEHAGAARGSDGEEEALREEMAQLAYREHCGAVAEGDAREPPEEHGPERVTCRSAAGKGEPHALGPENGTKRGAPRDVVPQPVQQQAPASRLTA